jgi:site-specific DNA-cytosine methylase
MNILSLFDGMSCGRIAADRAGINIDTYYASEIDKYAIKVSQANYPDTVQLGSVAEWRDWNIDWSSIDLLIGGSPCQGFSFAGKQLAFNDPRSALFFEYVNILNHIRKFNPNVKFLLENVKMKKEYINVINEQLGVKPMFINSALVSAQNRQRYYWCNWNVGQPEDKGIVLSDILENGVTDRDKSFCIDSNYWKGGTLEQYFEKHRRQLIFQLARGNNQGGFKALNGKTPTLSACSWHHNNFLATVDGFRKLTPLECERLQTVPDLYTAHVSDTQRYRMLGNGWTVDVIAHIFTSLLDELAVENAQEQLSDKAA